MAENENWLYIYRSKKIVRKYLTSLKPINLFIDTCKLIDNNMNNTKPIIIALYVFLGALALFVIGPIMIKAIVSETEQGVAVKMPVEHIP